MFRHAESYCRSWNKCPCRIARPSKLWTCPVAQLQEETVEVIMDIPGKLVKAVQFIPDDSVQNCWEAEEQIVEMSVARCPASRAPGAPDLKGFD